MSGPDDHTDRPDSPPGEPDEVSPEVRAHSDALDAWIEGTDPTPLEGAAAAMAQVRSELRAATPAPEEVDDLVASVLGSLDSTGDPPRPDETPGATGDRAAPSGLVRLLAAAAAVLVLVALGATALLQTTGEENAGDAATTEDALEEPLAEPPQDGGGEASTVPDTDVTDDLDESVGDPEEQTAEAAPASPGDSRSGAFASPEADALDDATLAPSPFAGLRVVIVVRIP